MHFHMCIIISNRMYCVQTLSISKRVRERRREREMSITPHPPNRQSNTHKLITYSQLHTHCVCIAWSTTNRQAGKQRAMGKQDFVLCVCLPVYVCVCRAVSCASTHKSYGFMCWFSPRWTRTADQNMKTKTRRTTMMTTTTTGSCWQTHKHVDGRRTHAQRDTATSIDIWFYRCCRLVYRL